MSNTTAAILVPATAILILSVQLLLCFRVRALAARLAPAVISAVLFAGFMLLSLTVGNGWHALAFLLCALWAAILLAACGLGWAVWGISRLIKYIKSK